MTALFNSDFNFSYIIVKIAHSHNCDDECSDSSCRELSDNFQSIHRHRDICYGSVNIQMKMMGESIKGNAG